MKYRWSEFGFNVSYEHEQAKKHGLCHTLILIVEEQGRTRLSGFKCPASMYKFSALILFKCGCVVRKLRRRYTVIKTLFFNVFVVFFMPHKIIQRKRRINYIYDPAASNSNDKKKAEPSQNMLRLVETSAFVRLSLDQQRHWCQLRFSPTNCAMVSPPIMDTVGLRVIVNCSNRAPRCSAQSNCALQCQSQSLSMVLKSQHDFLSPSSWTGKIVQVKSF